jgi:hypothetical protein
MGCENRAAQLPVGADDTQVMYRCKLKQLQRRGWRICAEVNDVRDLAKNICMMLSLRYRE